MTEKTKLWIWLFGIFVFGIAMFQLIPYLIVKYNFGSQWIAVFLIVLVVVIPQVTAQRNLRVLENMQETDEVDFNVPVKFTDYIPLVNDWELTRLYNDGSVLNSILSWLLRITTITLPLALLYLKLLIVWVDLGYTVTVIIMNVLTYSLYGYFIAKAGIIIHLLISINANFWYSLLLGITIVPGMMYLGYMVKVFMLRQDESVYERRLGEEYE